MRPRKIKHSEIQCCENCTHFFQHYVDHGNGRFHPCYCGHCCMPRIKNVKPDMICDLFESKDQSTNP